VYNCHVVKCINHEGTLQSVIMLDWIQLSSSLGSSSSKSIIIGRISLLSMQFSFPYSFSIFNTWSPVVNDRLYITFLPIKFYSYPIIVYSMFNFSEFISRKKRSFSNYFPIIIGGISLLSMQFSFPYSFYIFNTWSSAFAQTSFVILPNPPYRL
jgi:hypothetical protein